MSERNEAITAGGLSVMNQIPNTKPGNLMHHVMVQSISIAYNTADLHFHLLSYLLVVLYLQSSPQLNDNRRKC